MVGKKEETPCTVIFFYNFCKLHACVFVLDAMLDAFRKLTAVICEENCSFG